MFPKPTGFDVYRCPSIRSGQIHLARHSEREKKTTQTEELVSWCFEPSQPQKITSGLIRQKKRWEHYISEWTGQEFGRSQRAVENRENGEKLVAKSSLVP